MVAATDKTECLICHLSARWQAKAGYNSHDCPRCGKYELPVPGEWDIVRPDQQVRVSSWIRAQNAVGITPFIKLDTLRRVRDIPIPALRERANILLMALISRFPRFNDTFVISSLCDDLALQAQTYSADTRELNDLFAVLLYNDGYVDVRSSGPPNGLTIKGLLAADDLKRVSPPSDRGFVAVSFDADLTSAWTDGFDLAISAAGYHPVRIDVKDYVGGITDEIMAEIRKARFVVADYTGQRQGVYFEAGFALGLGLTVIPTCRADEISKLHFDIRHLNTLVWTTPSEIAASLEKRIRAVIGVGPNIL